MHIHVSTTTKGFFIFTVSENHLAQHVAAMLVYDELFVSFEKIIIINEVIVMPIQRNGQGGVSLMKVYIAASFERLKKGRGKVREE